VIARAVQEDKKEVNRLPAQGIVRWTRRSSDQSVPLPGGCGAIAQGIEGFTP
jgi:hypothetical protein